MSSSADRRLVDDRPARIDETAFREALSAHPAGVVVVTGRDAQGPIGLTATSFVSISLDPPLVAFAVDQGSTTWRRLQHVASMVVHLLGEDHDDLATRFALKGVDRFAEPTRWVPLTTGEPLLTDAASWLRCAQDEQLPLGDHDLVVLRVLDGKVDAEQAPLLYHRRGYRSVREHGA